MKKILGVFVLTTLIVSAYFLYKNLYPSSPQAKKLLKVKIMLPTLAQVEWIPYYVAIKNGYYSDEGLEVELLYNTKGTTQSFALLEANKTQFIMTVSENQIKARNKGIDAVAVMVVEPAMLNFVSSDVKFNLKKPQDLIGKKVGLASATGSGYIMLKQMLMSQGISIDQVETVPVGNALIAAFLDNKFPAAVLNFHDRIYIENSGRKLNVMRGEDYGGNSKQHIITHRKYLDTNKDVVIKFLKATEKGIEFAVANPKEAVIIYSELNPDDKNYAFNEKLWFSMITQLGYQGRKSGIENLSDWQKTQESLYAIGEIKGKTDPNLFFTNEYVPTL